MATKTPIFRKARTSMVIMLNADTMSHFMDGEKILVTINDSGLLRLKITSRNDTAPVILPVIQMDDNTGLFIIDHVTIRKLIRKFGDQMVAKALKAGSSATMTLKQHKWLEIDPNGACGYAVL